MLAVNAGTSSRVISISTPKRRDEMTCAASLVRAAATADDVLEGAADVLPVRDDRAQARHHPPAGCISATGTDSPCARRAQTTMPPTMG
jgi:hypothetical protein